MTGPAPGLTARASQPQLPPAIAHGEHMTEPAQTSAQAGAFSSSRVIRRATRFASNHAFVFVVGALLLVAPTQAATSWIVDQTASQFVRHGQFFGARFWIEELQFFFMAAPFALLTAWATVILDAERSASIVVEPVAKTPEVLCRAWPIILSTLAFHLCVTVGLLLLLVPGLMAMAAFLMATPIAAIEGVGPIRALTQSAALTRGNRWAVFALIAMVGVCLAILNWLAVKVITGGLPLPVGVHAPLPRYVFLPVLYALEQVPICALIGSIHVELVSLKGGHAISQTAEVFA
jgi:uncharacterized membrane protein